MKKTFIILSLMVFLLVPFQGYAEGWFWNSSDATEKTVEVIVESVEESVEVSEETTDTPEESLDDTNNSEQ